MAEEEQERRPAERAAEADVPQGGAEGVLDLSEVEPAPPPGPPPSPAVGAIWNPEPTRERIRGLVGVGLVTLLAIIAIGSFVLLATDVLTLDQVEGKLQSGSIL